MSDKMRPINFSSLIDHIFTEYNQEDSIFGIPSSKFFKVKEKSDADKSGIALFDSTIETPLGPAAGPHTQLAQNIISAYLTGGRFFELKTVQLLDDLKIDKPCIDVTDEAYNVEWSQELKLEEAYSEYLKAWLLLHILKHDLKLSVNEKNSFIFNMSVGYDLEGIKSGRVDSFINKMKDSSTSDLFKEYKTILLNKLSRFGYESLIQNISPLISNSVTLSTMHGCPPEDIEAISEYLINEKGLNTYVKLNPTLLGYKTVREILDRLGFNYIELDNTSFTHDIQMRDAIPMLRRLQKFAHEHGRSFGIKLSNTLGVNNYTNRLPGTQMYMSGRSLFPLTINLANSLAKEFEGNISISFSGGATVYNAREILETGIYPVTMVTDLLKPGGYSRLFQVAEHSKKTDIPGKINLQKLDYLASQALLDSFYLKGDKKLKPFKLAQKLPLFDCYIAPCTQLCPAHQNIPGYIRLVEEGKYSEAFKLIMATNPLPHITGYICDHKCMTACTRCDYDMPVEIREIKKEAARNGFVMYLDSLEIKDSTTSNSIKAAVIGAGPSGLSAAYYLKKAGFEVTVFERSGRAGGTVHEIIPGFRIPQEAIDNDIKLIEKTGVIFRFNSDENFSIEELKKEGYKYFYVALGASLSNEFGLKDKRPEIIYDAIDFLRRIRLNDIPRLGKNVAVIGGGNSAMDAARAALRIEGVEKVFIIYRRTKEFMPADEEEFQNAVSEGAVFKELLLPEQINGGILHCRKMILSDFDEKGRRNVVPSGNEFEWFSVDSIISAIGEHIDWQLLKKNNLLKEDQNKITVDPLSNETSIENVFTGGDVLRGPSTVIEAVADGRKAANAIIEKECSSPFIFSENINIQKPPDEKVIIQKKGTVYFEEKKNNLSSLCLSCDVLCNKCVEVCPNRANVLIRSKNISGNFRDKYQIIHLDHLCNECGNCASFCPYEGAPYKNKVTLFLNEDDFLESTNDGFCFEELSEDGQIVKFRILNKSGSGTLNNDGSIITRDPANNSSDEFNKFMNLIFAVYKDYSYLFHKTDKPLSEI